MRTGAYDSVASLLIALLFIVGLAVGGLFIIWLTNRLMFSQKPVPVELVEYAGRGDHAAGYARDMEPPGPEELEEEMYEPQVEATLEAVTDVVTTQAAALDSIATAAEATVKGGGAAWATAAVPVPRARVGATSFRLGSVGKSATRPPG
jgi:hypothetical protein